MRRAIARKLLVRAVTIVVALGPGGYRERVSIRLLTQTVARISREVGIPLEVGRVEVVSAPREFGQSPEERFRQNQHYFPMGKGLTLVLAPPLAGGALAGVASTICGDGVAPAVALVNSPTYWPKRTKAYLRHELLHLLGATHKPGIRQSLMNQGPIADVPADPETKREVAACVRQ